MSELEAILESDLIDDPTRSPATEPDRIVPTATRRRLWALHAMRAALTLGALGAFAVIERTIHGEKPNAFDLDVMVAMGRARRPWLTRVAKAITWFGGVPGAGGIAVASVLASRRRPRAALQVALGSLGGIVAELGLKQRFGRPRPQHLPHLEVVGSKSFPSGHAMASSSLYLTLAYVASRSRRLRSERGSLLAAAALLASAVGLTRVYLGVHWPTDVLGGLALGTAWASAAEAGFDLTGAQALERTAQATPRGANGRGGQLRGADLSSAVA
ncbi:MAG: phosphatase PAP2 family protein [Deltaproteobacteria bacterium]|nr:phosphatase PAP2 family protein [Deltaproteobacteria bacterium]